MIFSPLCVKSDALKTAVQNTWDNVTKKYAAIYEKLLADNERQD